MSSLAGEALKGSDVGLSNVAALQYDDSARHFTDTLPPAVCVPGDVACRAFLKALAPVRNIWKPFEFANIQRTSG